MYSQKRLISSSDSGKRYHEIEKKWKQIVFSFGIFVCLIADVENIFKSSQVQERHNNFNEVTDWSFAALAYRFGLSFYESVLLTICKIFHMN